MEDRPDTADADYTARLQRNEAARWKRILGAQVLYRWNLDRLQLGRAIDVGCGIGRNLAHLGPASVGVDHNPTSVAAARARGLVAYTGEEFQASRHARADAFDGLLAAHLLEHLAAAEAREVIATYLPFVRRGGTAAFITPQERGFASDPTHVRFVGFAESSRLAAELGLRVTRAYSFPFPRAAGRLFTYNEFVVVARKV